MTKRFTFLLTLVLSATLLANWQENLSKGKDLLDQHWYKEQEALPILKAAFKENPKDKEVLFYLGRTLYQLRKFKEAAPLFKKALTIDPNYAEAHAYYAYCVGRLADKEKSMGKQLSMQNEAKKHLEKALKVDPDYADGWMAYAIGMHWFGRRGGGIKWAYESSEKYFQKAFKINPRNPYLNVEYGYFMLTMKKKNEADKYFKRAMSIAKRDVKDNLKNSDVPRSIAIYLEDYNFFKEALSFAQKALEWNPKDIHTFDFQSNKKLITRLKREIASGKKELKNVSDEM